MGILITDHNVRETLGICDIAFVMKSGEMLDYGTSEADYATAKRFRNILLG